MISAVKGKPAEGTTPWLAKQKVTAGLTTIASSAWEWTSSRGSAITANLSKGASNYSNYFWHNNTNQYLQAPYNEKIWFYSIPKALKNDFNFCMKLVQLFPEVEPFLTGTVKEKVADLLPSLSSAQKLKV